MKNYILILFLLILSKGIAQSINFPEEGCPITIIKTDPNNYTNPNDPNQERKWNWMEEPNYTYYRKDFGTLGIATILVNPFYDQSPTLNTIDFVNQDYKDFQPADGWELLYKKFGSPAQGISYPFFILYNRYSGKIRIFVNIVNSSEFTFNNCEIALSFDKNFTDEKNELTQSAVLNNLGEHAFSPIEMQRNSTHYSYNQALDNGNQNGYQWMTADFNTLFDPCTCGLVSNFIFRVRLKNHVKINGTIFGNYSTLLDSDNPANESDEIGGFWGSIQKYSAYGAGIINGVEGVLTSANKQYENGEKLIGEAQKFVNNSNKAGVITADEAANINNKIGEVLKLVPYVGSIFTLASTAITFVKETIDDYNNLSNSEKINQSLSFTSIAVPKINLTIDAGINYESNRILEKLIVPGSIGSNNVIHTNPVYDNTLGVFNLMEQPEFIYKKYNTLNTNSPIGTIYYLALNKIPKILFNNTSGLKIKNIEYAIVFENQQLCYLTESEGLYNQNTMLNPFFPEKFGSYSPVLLIPNFQNSIFPFIPIDTLYKPEILDKEKYFNSIGLFSLTKDSLTIPPFYNNKIIFCDEYSNSLFQTDFLNQSCVSKKTIYNFSPMKNPKLKVKLILEPIEKLSNSKVEEVVHILTFPGNVTTKNSFYTPNYDTILNEIKLNFDDLSFNNQENINTFKNLTLKNETVKTSIRVLNSLVLDENVVFEANKNYVLESTGTIEVNKTFTLPNSSTLQLIAGREITINPEAIINPETVIMIDSTIICNCEKEKDVFPTIAEIAALCNSNKYYERSNGPLKQDEEGIDDENLSSKNDILLYPNPSENRTTIESEDEIIGLKIYDVSGKEFELNPIGTKYKINLDFSNLEHGLYLINIQTISQEVTKQFVKL
jgi:hypothetical protein